MHRFSAFLGHGPGTSWLQKALHSAYSCCCIFPSGNPPHTPRLTFEAFRGWVLIGQENESFLSVTASNEYSLGRVSCESESARPVVARGQCRPFRIIGNLLLACLGMTNAPFVPGFLSSVPC